jgi:hypothetical protein
MPENANFSFKNIVAGLAFGTKGAYSDPNRFANYVAEKTGHGNSLLNPEDCLDELSRWGHQLTATRRRAEGEIGQSEAFDWLVGRDLLRIVSTARNLPPEILQIKSIEESAKGLPTYAESLGLTLRHASLRVVDTFPSPHEDASFAAMTYDTVDEKTYGMRPGVALLRSSLQPLYSINLFAHELVHVAIGRVETDRLARGLEEGLADLIGMTMSGRLLGRTTAEQILLNSRTRHGRDQLGRLYRDNLVQACGIALAIGESALLSVVRNACSAGRQKIKEFEESIMTGHLTDSVRASESTPMDDTQTFALKFLASSPDNVVSPLAVLIGEELSSPVHISDLLADIGVESNAGGTAIAELQSRLFMAVISDGTVEFSETKFYSDLGQLRYECP